MDYLLPRPPGMFDPSKGLLRAEQFQTAYLTNDLDRAKTLFTERLGIRDFQDLGGPLPHGGTIRVALAWVGTIMYELMETEGSEISVYADWLPREAGFHIRHHHLGYILHDRPQLDGVETAARAVDWPVAHRNANPLVEVMFVHAPELGHYLEYMLPTAAGLDFFNGVPRS
jgi:hypothetical protein